MAGGLFVAGWIRHVRRETLPADWKEIEHDEWRTLYDPVRNQNGIVSIRPYRSGLQCLSYADCYNFYQSDLCDVRHYWGGQDPGHATPDRAVRT